MLTVLISNTGASVFFFLDFCVLERLEMEIFMWPFFTFNDAK